MIHHTILMDLDLVKRSHHSYPNCERRDLGSRNNNSSRMDGSGSSSTTRSKTSNSNNGNSSATPSTKKSSSSSKKTSSTATAVTLMKESNDLDSDHLRGINGVVADGIPHVTVKKGSKKEKRGDVDASNGRESPTIGGGGHHIHHGHGELLLPSSSGVSPADSSVMGVIKSFVMKTIVFTFIVLLKMAVFGVWAAYTALSGIVRGQDARVIAFNRIRDSSNAFMRGLGDSPSGIVKKILLTIWCIAVVFAVLNLMGYRPGKYLFGDGSDALEHNVKPEVEVQAAAESEDDDNLKMLPGAQDARKKMSKKEELAFACEEINCNTKCWKKASPKCAKSDGCMKERAKICKKRCRRARCDARCKEEPPLGYVEREMKIEKCKEKCQTPKCKTKCDEEFQPCKSKCYAKANKIICPDIPPEAAEGPKAFNLKEPKGKGGQAGASGGGSGAGASSSGGDGEDFGDGSDFSSDAAAGDDDMDASGDASFDMGGGSDSGFSASMDDDQPL